MANRPRSRLGEWAVWRTDCRAARTRRLQAHADLQIEITPTTTHKLLFVSKVNVVENCVAKTAIIDEKHKKKRKKKNNSNNVDSSNNTALKVGKTEK